MLPVSPPPEQPELFRSAPVKLVDRRHPLVRRAGLVQRDRFAAAFGPLHRAGVDRTGLPPRLMFGLHLVEHRDGLFAAAVCARFLDSPHVQLVCGESHFRHPLPPDRSSMSRWRKRIGAERLALRLAATLTTARPAQGRRAEALRAGEHRHDRPAEGGDPPDRQRAGRGVRGARRGLLRGDGSRPRRQPAADAGRRRPDAGRAGGGAGPQRRGRLEGDHRRTVPRHLFARRGAAPGGGAPVRPRRRCRRPASARSGSGSWMHSIIPQARLEAATRLLEWAQNRSALRRARAAPSSCIAASRILSRRVHDIGRKIADAAAGVRAAGHNQPFLRASLIRLLAFLISLIAISTAPTPMPPHGSPLAAAGFSRQTRHAQPSNTGLSPLALAQPGPQPRARCAPDTGVAGWGQVRRKTITLLRLQLRFTEMRGARSW